jgi:hypothetical protein
MLQTAVSGQDVTISISLPFSFIVFRIFLSSLTDLPYPAPAPHFIAFRVFLIDVPKCSIGAP